MTETPTLSEHLAAHLRWWDWAVIAINIFSVAWSLVVGDYAAAINTLVIAALYVNGVWWLREAQVWRAASFTLLDVLAERERQQRP